jgi:putative transposase
MVNYHLVWTPQRRKKVLVGDIERRLREIILEVCQEKKWAIIALEIMPDHIHLFVNTPVGVAAHQVIKAIKSRSSRLQRPRISTTLKASFFMDSFLFRLYRWKCQQ